MVLWVIEAGIPGGHMTPTQEMQPQAGQRSAANHEEQASPQVQKQLQNLEGVPGYKLIFDLLVPLTANNLLGSGFYSLISVDDMGRAIQIDFWNGQAWARESDFSRSATEGALFDTSLLRRYSLAVSGGFYTLSADGVDLFSGMLRTYPDALRSIPGFYYIGESN
mgnify:CR=1 FL=1